MHLTSVNGVMKTLSEKRNNNSFSIMFKQIQDFTVENGIESSSNNTKHKKTEYTRFANTHIKVQTISSTNSYDSLNSKHQRLLKGKSILPT